MRNPFTIYTLENLQYKKAVLVGKNMQDHLPPANFQIVGSMIKKRGSKTNKKASMRDLVTYTTNTPYTTNTTYTEYNLSNSWIAFAVKWLQEQGVVVVA